MFPDGRRKLSSKTWQCPWCGAPFKDGDVCPNDEEHWSQFSTAVRSADTPVLAGKRRQGAA
jgi:rubrerythrin